MDAFYMMKRGDVFARISLYKYIKMEVTFLEKIIMTRRRRSTYI